MKNILKLSLVIFLLSNSFAFAQSLSLEQVVSGQNDILLADDSWATQKRAMVDVDKTSRKKVFVWQERDAVGSANKNIRCEVYTETMSLVSSFIVNTTTTGDQIYPVVKVNQNDNSFIVSWCSWINNINPNDANQYDIYAKKIRFSSISTDAATSDIFVNTGSSSTTNGRQILPLVAFDYITNEAVIAWLDQDGQDRGVTSVDNGSYARRMNYSGAALATISGASQFLINTVTLSHQTIYAIDISPLTGELYTLCHSLNYSSSTTYDVILKKFTRGNDNNYVGGSEITVNTYTSGSQSAPSIVINPKTGNVAINWTDNTQDGSGYGAYFKVFDRYGNLLKGETRINQSATGNQLISKGVWDENTNVITFFYWYSESSMINVRYQMFDKDYNYLGSEVAAESTNLQNYYAGVYSVAYESASKKLLMTYDGFQSSSSVPSKSWFRQFGYTPPASTDNSYNYVRNQIILKENVTNPSTIDALPAGEMLQTTDYFDGLGRTIQNVVKQATPFKNDLVQYIEYDDMGRTNKSYLPYSSVESNGGFKSAAKNEQKSFYTTSTDPLMGKTGSTNNFTYGQTIYEAAPGGNVLEQSMPGDAWGIGSGHTITKAYRFNTTTDNVAKWTYDISNGNFLAYTTSAQTYSANTLFVTEIIDENGSIGAKIIEFKNKAGQVVLKKVERKANSNDYLLTYYVYDNFGQLRYTIPPEAVAAAIVKANGYTYNDDFVKKWIFCYVYDAQKRLIEKRVPGADQVYIVYDKLDRQVLTQDGNQRPSNKYFYTKYDALNRPVFTGITAITGTIATVRSAAATSSVLYETRTSSGYEGYTSNAYPPISWTDMLTVNYYDDYDFNYNGTADYSYQTAGFSGEEPIPSDKTKGIITGSKSRVIGNTSWLVKTVFYDKKGRNIQTQSNSPINSNVQDVTTNVFSFAGQILKSKTVHTPGSPNPTITVSKRFEFDHAGRLKNVFQQNNTDAEQNTVQYNYNEIGQNTEKNLHKISSYNFLQSVDYRYNIRGMLSNVNNVALNNDGAKNDDSNDLIGMEYLYNEGLTALGGTAQYNGNISGMLWKTSTDTTPRAYGFAYNYLGQLCKAKYAQRHSSGNYTINVGRFTLDTMTYDKNGNIKSLMQRGQTSSGTFNTMDNLTYYYTGNKLIGVNDASTDVTAFNAFKDNGNTGTPVEGSTGTYEYTYDYNGNQTKDANKNITSITYNHLNLPSVITFTTSGNRIEFKYNTFGEKVQKLKYVANVLSEQTDYVNGFVYVGNGSTKSLKSFPTEEGLVSYSIAGFRYDYQIKDHLGNVRVSFANTGTLSSPVLTILEQNSYYPSGLTFCGLNNTIVEEGFYKYNGMELEADLNLNWYDYNSRHYDVQIGRFPTLDPSADSYTTSSPYSYVFNNPINYIDPSGADPVKKGDKWYDSSTGAFLGWDKSVGSSHSYASGAFGTYDDEVGRIITDDAVHIFYGGEGSSSDLLLFSAMNMLSFEEAWNKQPTIVGSMQGAQGNGGGSSGNVLTTTDKHFNGALGTISVAVQGYDKIPNALKRSYAYKLSKTTGIKSGKIFQSVKGFSKAAGKVATKLGPVGTAIGVGVISYEVATDTWDAHTVVNAGMMVGAGVAAFFGAPVVLTGIAIYGVADYAFDIGDKIDNVVGRNSGTW